MILSYYEDAMLEADVQFDYSLQIPSKIKISDVDLTSILSNSLENALHAVLELSEEHRRIDLNITEKSGKLLISIKNPYARAPKFINDMPVAGEERHGFGTQSIRYTAEKLGANCQFSLTDGMFVLRVIL